jgi:hypothetical protein
LSARPAGLLLQADGRGYYLPIEAVAFVAPLSEAGATTLVMPRGRMPLIELGRARAQGPRRRAAVAVETRRGHVAFAVDRVELVEEGADTSDLSHLDPEEIVGSSA